MHVQLKDAGDEIAALRNGTFGIVRIGAGPTWLRRHLPVALAKVIAKHPDIRVQVDGSFDETLFRALRQSELDFVVAEIPAIRGSAGSCGDPADRRQARRLLPRRPSAGDPSAT